MVPHLRNKLMSFLYSAPDITQVSTGNPVFKNVGVHMYSKMK
jgi:hypothetical protein